MLFSSFLLNCSSFRNILIVGGIPKFPPVIGRGGNSIRRRNYCAEEGNINGRHCSRIRRGFGVRSVAPESVHASRAPISPVSGVFRLVEFQVYSFLYLILTAAFFYGDQYLSMRDHFEDSNSMTPADLASKISELKLGGGSLSSEEKSLFCDSFSKLSQSVDFELFLRVISLSFFSQFVCI